MPADVRECHQSGISLRGVKPVPHPRVRRNIRLAPEPNITAIAAVIQHREKNNEPFHCETEWDSLKFPRFLVVKIRTDQRVTVGPEMFRQECPYGNDAGQRMQFAKEITRVRPGRSCGHALSAA